MAECDSGIDAGGAARRDGAAGDGRQGQDQGYGAEGDGVGGRNAHEERANHAGDTEGGGESNGQTEGHLAHSLCEDHAQNRRRGCAEGDADAEFVGALIDGLRHYGVEAHRGKHQSYQGENGEHAAEDAQGPERHGELIFERATSRAGRSLSSDWTVRRKASPSDAGATRVCARMTAERCGSCRKGT